ncbi:PLP-dependent aminotransferase family protein [Isoalcanivorax beigongshangi]|uniref:PLP-dependent aminotransferase family protein n=1 Tax=Isoalcanivorax beigongshangi TaxID=3238810 RepID=A0ABV4AG10_9GAMM
MAFSERVARLKSSLIREILAAAQRPGVMSFAGGLPAESMLPAVDWSALPAGFGQYGMSEGEPELRQRIAAEARALGIECSAEQVLVTAGSQQALDLVAKLFIDPGTPVLVESPTYLAALQSFQLFGARCVTVSLNDDGPDLEQLAARLEQERPAFAYLIPTFQNPSAVRYSAEVRTRVAELLDRHNVVLVEDEPYRELVYDDQLAQPLVAQLRSADWVYTGTLSKTLLPGLRIGYLIASPKLFPYLLRLKQAADLHTNRIGQWQALQWLGTPALAAHIAELQVFYRDRRDAMDAALRRHFGDLAEWQTPAGGLFFWLRLRQPVDTRTLLPQALAQDVAFMPGEAFFVDPDAHPGYVRLNFSHVPPELMEEGVARLAGVFRAAAEGGKSDRSTDTAAGASARLPAV